MRSKDIFLLTLAAACLASPLTFADVVDKAVDAFHETCLAHGPDFDGTVALAKARGWTLLFGDAALAPVDEVKAFQSWQASGEDLPGGTRSPSLKAP